MPVQLSGVLARSVLYFINLQYRAGFEKQQNGFGAVDQVSRTYSHIFVPLCDVKFSFDSISGRRMRQPVTKEVTQVVLVEERLNDQRYTIQKGMLIPQKTLQVGRSWVRISVTANKIQTNQISVKICSHDALLKIAFLVQVGRGCKECLVHCRMLCFCQIYPDCLS